MIMRLLNNEQNKIYYSFGVLDIGFLMKYVDLFLINVWTFDEAIVSMMLYATMKLYLNVDKRILI